MALRIKSRWTEAAKEKLSDDLLNENAQALAYIYWRLALDRAKNLHGEDFVYDTDEQRIYVIGEYLAMLVQMSDRIVYARLEDEDRQQFITTLAMRLADHMQDNATDLFGEGDYRKTFITMLNIRAEGYVETEYSIEDGPSYGFLHYFGSSVHKVLDEKHHDNKWVIDQIMDVDGPDTIKKASKALMDLFS